MKTWSEAVADVQKYGIALRNLTVCWGDPEDHGVKGPCVPRWEGGRQIIDYTPAEEEAWLDAGLRLVTGEWDPGRRWAYVETSAGLAEDENGEITVYNAALDFQTGLRSLGWEYMGSGGHRVEVDPATAPTLSSV